MRKFLSFPRLVTLQLAGLSCAMLLHGQSTTITTGNTLLQGPVKRMGINLGGETSYDSGQMIKNLLFANPGFEGEIYQSIIRCVSGTATVCYDDNWYSGWPANFWTGATFEFFYGNAQGRTGTITSFTAATGSTGAVFGLSGSSTVPNVGDYMIVRQRLTGNATAGWSTSLGGHASITANVTDLPPTSNGLQTVAMNAPAVGDSALLTSYFDGTPGVTFVQLNGTYQLSFKAKGVSGSQGINVSLIRNGTGSTFVSQQVSLSNNWATYNLNFSASENGTATGPVQVIFTIGGPNVVYLDDVSLTQLNGDPTNTTVFRDPVVNTLKALNPGLLRFWANQLGDTLDNMISDPTGRQRTGYSAFSTGTSYVNYSLPEFLELCQNIGSEPWIVVPSTFSTTDAANLIEYLASSSNTTYGGKRASQGHTAPWTSLFSKIHLEFGNEEWNPGFKGGSIEYSEPYGARATTIFAAMRSDPAFVTSSFDLILGGQSASPGRNQGIQNACNNNDTFAIAPYMMNTVNNYDNNENLYGSTFAEAEAYQTASGTAEGVDNGLMLQNQSFLQASSHPTPLASYEMNLSTLTGSITQSVLNTYVSSLGAGLAVVDSMLQQMRQGVILQNLFALPQYIDNRTDGKSVYLWGSVIDMGVTNRRRPQFLAMQLANQAIGNNAVMLQTVHTGANPTWNQPSMNTVQFNNAHYLQSFAFQSSTANSMVIFNLHRSSYLPVTFAGATVPNGSVQMQQLTSSNITDTNETANLVVPTSTTLSNFNAATGMTLPPYSMTVLSWAPSGNSSPLISGVTVSGISSTTATISWTTNQASTTQVAYGTTTAYGSSTPLNSSLVTSHTATLTGLTPGTTYNFGTISTNSTGGTSTSDNTTFATTALPAPQISAVASSGLTPTSVTITWTTDQPATSQVQYGLSTAFGSMSTLNSALTTSHSVTLTGLAQNTIYYYQALSLNSAGTASQSGNFNFQTPVTPAVITNVSATGIASNSVTINWTTDQPSSSQVEYGTTTNYGTFSGANNTLVTAHSVTFGNLTPATTYNYAVLSTNALGAVATSTNFTFTTLSPPPSITGVAVTGITTTGATISWTTDQPSTTQVAYGTTTAYGSLSTLNSTLTTAHSVTLANLTPATLYNFQALSSNSLGVQGTSQNATVTTATPPTNISALIATAIGTTTATITWTTDQPSSSQVEYGITTAYGGLSTANSTLVTSHSVALSGLSAGTVYNFAALSTNSSGTLSTSANATFQTSAPPAVISAVAVTGITPTTATVTWTTDQPATTQVEYGTSATYGSLTTFNSTLTTSHSATIIGLSPSTNYNVAAMAVTALGANSVSSNVPFTTTTPAPIITNLSASNIALTSATITWTTDQPSTSQVEFGTTATYGSLSTANNTLVTSHTVTIAGLTPGTLYNFAALSANSGGTLATSTNGTLTTTGNPVPPVISGVASSNITSTTATITWTTDQAATSQVEFGVTASYGGLSTANPVLVTSHSVLLSGLTAGTTYNYAALSSNSATLLTTSPNFTFTTSGAVTPPVISAVTAINVQSTSATITWTTDQPATSQVEFGSTTSYGSLSTADSTLVTSHSLTLTNLTPGTTYNYAALSTNSSSQLSTSSNFVFSTGTASNPPPVITNVTSSGITNTTATITWTTDQASTSQVEFGLTSAYGSLSTANSSFVTTHTVVLNGLTPSTTYNYAALSSNNLGIVGTSTNFTFTTGSGPVPTVISSVVATSISSTSALITWTTDQLASGQVEYGTTSSYGLTTTPNFTLTTTHSATLTGLTPSTTYNFAALSTNGAGVVTTSSNFTFNTTAVGAPVISAVTIAALSTTSATITWTTDVVSTTQMAYGTTLAYGSQSPLNNTLSLTHSVTLTGLTVGTTYNFKVMSATGGGILATTPNYTFTTTAGPAPVISAVTATNITSTSATITWTTDLPSSSQVSFGTSPAYSSQTASDNTMVTSHSVNLTGLTPATTYNYAVTSTTAQGAIATSANFTFSAASQPGPAISSIAVWPVADTSATILWVTDQNATSQVNYGLTTAYGSQATVGGTTVYHAVPLSGLTPGTTYNYQIVTSSGSGGGTTTSSNNTFTTSGTAPFTITGVAAGSLTGSSATITWTTSQPATTQVVYGTTNSYGSQSTLNSSLVTSHTVTLTGLLAGTTYNFAAVSTNSANTTLSSTNFTFATTGTAPPTITAVTATSITSTSAIITWTTNQTSSSQVAYGTTTAYGSQSALNSSLVTSHSVTLTGLTPGTNYNYAVTSANGSGASATSTNFTFATPAAPPVISAVTATSITSTSAIITWTTDQTSSSQVAYGTTIGYGSQSALNSSLVTTHSVTLTGLTPNTTYNYAVTSANGTGISTTSTNFTFATTTTPPVISAVTATSITTTSAIITWTTDQTSSSQVAYGTTPAYGSQSALNSTLVTSHSVTLTGLTPGTTYNYAVTSANGTSVSATSANFTFATTAAPPVITAVTATSISSTSAIITWTTDQTSSSQVAYGTTPAYGSQSALNSSLVTTHSVTLTGLTPSTTYNYAVTSVNGSSASTTSANFTFATTAAAAPVISAVTATSITNTSAIITWTTDQTSSSQVAYGTTTAYGSQSALNGSLVTAHSVTLTGLTPGTTYNYAVTSVNGSSVSTTSANFTFATTTPPPVISAVTATSITTTSAIITWTTDQTSSSQVAYGTTTAYGSQSALNSSLVTSHSVTLTGLTPGTTYNYAATSTNGSSVSATSTNFTFATAAAAPVISAVTATSITTTSAIITWTTDQPSSSQVAYGTTTAYGSQSALNSSLVTSHSVTLTGLTPGTTYNYAVTSTNGSSASTTSGNFIFATTAPPVISAVTATSITATSAIITWTTDQTSSSQVSYGTTTAYGSQSALNSSLVTSHSVTLTGLTGATTYNYAVISANGAGASATSTNFTFTTATPPPVITTVVAGSVTATSAIITWTTDRASNSQVSYGTTTAYGLQSTLNSTLVTSHSVTLTGLTAGTTYNYAAISGYATGTPTTSGNFTFTTTQNPPVISAVTATSITTNSAIISWTTDQASTTQVNYGTTAAYGSQSALNSSLVTSHSVTLTGLQLGTTYNFDVVSGYATGTPTTSGNFTFTTLASAPPVISSVASYPVANTTATILWGTDVNSSSVVNYGTTTAYGSTATVSTPTIYHNVPLSGLIPGTTYHFQVSSTNASGGTATSADFSFTTSGTAPVVFTNVAVSGITSTSATITWTTNYASNSQVYFGKTTTYGTLSTLNSALVTTHSVTLSGLATATTYNYELLSNTATLSGVSANFTFSTTAAGPPVLSAVTATPLNATSATITWTTDQASTTQVSYGTTSSYGSQSPLNNTLVTAHSVTLTGLTPGTTYNYAALSTNSSSQTGTSVNLTFATPTGAAANISAVTATAITANSATITWTTDQPTTSQVNYGTTTGYGLQSALNSSLVTSHSVTITGLTSATTYNFDVVSLNSSNTPATSGNFTFTTTTVPAPVITSVSALSITSTSATITWTTDQASNSQVNYGTTVSYGSQSPLNSSLVTSHSVTLTGLTASTTYNYQVLSANSANTLGTSANLTFTTTSAVAGPNISGFAWWGITGTGFYTSWSTDQASDTAIEYGTTMSLGSVTPVQTALTASHSVILTGLNGGTTYYFRARSTNAGGGVGYSAINSITTLATTGPVISNVVATPGTGNAATVSWTSSVAASSYVEYGPDTNYGRYSGTTSGTSTALGWTPSGTIHFKIHSMDSLGNTTVTGDFTFVEP